MKPVSEIVKYSPLGAPGFMIVCSCNVLSDHEVRHAVNTAEVQSAAHVYGCLGCSAQCGRCVRTIRKIMDEALTGAARGCPSACPYCAQKQI